MAHDYEITWGSPTYEIPSEVPRRKQPTRKRYIKLTKIAREVCQLLDKRGLKAGEACRVRKIAEEMINLEDK